jgi:RNA recognition motif. (a.k.a. RRM, RBD, or RNP domain)
MLIGIGNLTYTTTEEEIRQLFESSGAVERINLRSDCETGRLRGFGFVDIPDTRAAQAAVQELLGTVLTGLLYTSPKRSRVHRTVGSTAPADKQRLHGLHTFGAWRVKTATPEGSRCCCEMFSLALSVSMSHQPLPHEALEHTHLWRSRIAS